MEIETVYSNLTSIDIEEQKRIWDDRGKGYYGEYLLFKKLYPSIAGQCKMLMNLNIPTENGKTTEIDLLMIHETGLYVFEAKHYKGTIYGSFEDDKWTQYFRTQANSYFNSPVKQNQYHIEALKKLYPDVPIRSFIIFTNSATDVKVTGWENTDTVVCNIDNINQQISNINSLGKQVLSDAQIDSIFNSLSIYSPMIHETISYDGKVESLSGYINHLNEDFSSELKSIRKSEKRKFKSKLALAIGLSVVFCAVILILALGVAVFSRKQASEAQNAQQKAEQELADFSKKFKQVEPMNGGDLKLEDNFYEVYDVSFEKSFDLKDTFIFACKIRINGAKYGIHIHKNTSIIVQMKDGTVAEYVFGSQGTFPDRYIGPFNGWYNFYELPSIYIFTDSSDSIDYIKLSNFMVCAYGSDMNKDLLPGTEFELYRAD